MRREHARRGGAVDEQALLSWLPVLPLGHADEHDRLEAELGEHVVHFVDLPQPAVDEQQVRRRYFALAAARIAAVHGFPQRAIVVTRAYARDVEASILFLHRPFRPEHHAGSNGALAARVADAEAL